MMRRWLCRLDALVTNELRAFTLPGVTWPVLAGVVDNEIIVAAGVCPHEDVSLVDAELCGSQLTCPGHGYQFDVRTGACRHDASLLLRRYRVTTDGIDVWVDLL